MEADELKSLVMETERAWQALGKVYYGPTEMEKSSLKFRRSLYVAQDMKAGDLLTTENIKAIRPGYGLAPKYLPILLGKTVKKNVVKGTPVNWDLI